MTEAVRPARRRMPKRVLRILAWAAGLASFATPFAAIAVAPKPAVSAPPPRQVIIRKIIRNVYTTVPAANSAGGGSSAPQVKYVYVGGGSAPAAPASTSGSHP
jgi:hypothetical protein